MFTLKFRYDHINVCERSEIMLRNYILPNCFIILILLKFLHLDLLNKIFRIDILLVIINYFKKKRIDSIEKYFLIQNI